MNVVFYLSAIVAVVATGLVIIQLNAVHALLYLVVSLLSVALIFYTLGAPFIAALEVIIYAGAIMVLFVFVSMLLNLGEQAAAQERRWLSSNTWIGPAVLAAILLVELIYVLVVGNQPMLAGGQPTLVDSHFALAAGQPVEPVMVGMALFGPYLLGVELVAILLLAGLVGAFHLGRRDKTAKKESPDGYHPAGV
ncbi:MAG: NADH-quinone oxidoreductase subunit J [Caldilineaceae bacterium]